MDPLLIVLSFNKYFDKIMTFNYTKIPVIKPLWIYSF
jgi:hypothetical protein